MIQVQRFCLPLVFLVMNVLPSWGQFKNVKVAESGYGVGIAVNLRNPANLAVSVAPDRVCYSLDKGATWAETRITSSYGFFGAPAISSDDRGDLYFFHASEGKEKNHLVSHVSEDGGKTWEEGAPFGPVLTAATVQGLQAGPDARGNQNVTWTQRDGAACTSQIYLSTSSNGKRWSTPLQLSQNGGTCVEDNTMPMSAMTAMSPDGKVYAAWSCRNKIFMDRSFDGGSMWLSTDLPIIDQWGGRDLEIPGHGLCRNNAVLAVDHTKTVHKGMIYLVWADKRQGDKGTDVWFVRSSNYGDNWTTPLRINNDNPGHHHYLPWMTIDQTSGNIYIVYYDRGAYDDTQTDVYLAYSTDTGSSFKTVKISESPFTATPVEGAIVQTFIAAHKGIVTPVWTRTENGKASVWTTIVDAGALTK